MKPEQLFYLDPKPGISLQAQIKEMLVAAILDGHLAPGAALPSCRKLAQNLSVSRNTVVLVYDRLLEEGYLVSRERQGHFVNPDFDSGLLNVDQQAAESTGPVDWQTRFQLHPSAQHNLTKPAQWRQCRYPFIFGQLDPELFPVAEWRDCTRQATSSLLTRDWLGDSVDADDPMLVEQLRSRVLPRRGIRCGAEEVLVTLGTQQSLYLLAQLLGGQGVTLGLENPGYVDVRNIFELTGTRLKSLQVDAAGLVVDQQLQDCDYLFVTPSHQAPTTVTLPLERRLALLEGAATTDQIIIEDDYESEINFFGQPTPALKSLDKEDRVIYVGSLSKSLSPGLRIGYLVGPAPLIREARALRRLMLRHPPTNNQRTLALFLAGGHHDTMLRRLTQVYKQRFECLSEALETYMPEVKVSHTTGGSSLWLEGPAGLNASRLQTEALKHSVFIEPGRPHFYFADKERAAPDHFFRLGFSAIKTEAIQPGIQLLATLMREQLSETCS